MQALKEAFDPHSQLNPDKICTLPDSAEGPIKLNEAPMRGDLERTISERVWQDFPGAVRCNGVCYNYDL